VSSSIEDRPSFLSLVKLLEPLMRESPLEAWDIGEQEAAIRQLVSDLSTSNIALTGLDRARIAVLAEEWGCWDAVITPLKAVHARDGDESVAVIEATEEGNALNEAFRQRTAGWPDWSGTAAIAWIRCLKCGDILIRVHEVMCWGLSLTPNAYAIAQMDRTAQEPLTQRFPNGSAALTALIDPHHAQA
jgi:hypothetical protein